MRFLNYDSSKHEESFFKLLNQLRPHINLNLFRDTYREAHLESNYQLVGLFDGDEPVALMGYRVLTDFVHGRHLYIDDLVTDAKTRSQGFGAKMLKHAEVLAQELNCANLRLSTGVENEQGKKFYIKNGWNQRAVVFKKKLTV